MDKMPFYELEELLDSLKMLNEKEEEERKKQEKNEKSGMPNFNLNSMSRQMKGPSTSMPSMPNLKF